MLKWYDYFVVYIFADALASNIFRLIYAPDVWSSAFFFCMLALGYFGFLEYANMRKEWENDG